MKKNSFLIKGAILMILVSYCSMVYAQQPHQFFVATNGHDDNPGTIELPFASIKRAQAAVRALKEQRILQQPVYILLREGQYFINEPIVFKPEDSGTENTPIYYQAYANEEVTISGGVQVNGWEQQQDGLWKVSIANPAEDFYFHQLFIDDQRRQRARTPNEGYWRNGGPIVPAVKKWLKPSKKYEIGDRAMRFQKGQFSQSMNSSEVMVGLLHQWTATLHWIKDIDFDQRITWFTNDYNWPIGYWETQQRFYIENYFEALDQPGEWYYNKEEGILYYFPFDHENIDDIDAIISVLPELIRIEGEPENEKFVEYINFENIQLKHADWQVGKTENIYLQAVAQLDHNAAIYATGLKNSTFINCEIAHIGGHGIYLSRGCKNNLVQQCHIHDLGGGGVYIGEGGFRCGIYENEALKPSHNTIDNNYIHDATNVFIGSAGIWIGSSSHNKITHNEIADMYYMGINAGWCWHYEASEATHNIIEYNYIHHIGEGRLSDSGGIYTLGSSPGTRIRFNHIHDCHGYPYLAHMHGLYNDQASEHILMENNICYNISHQGYNLHWGRNLTLRNNIFVDYEHEALRLGRGTKNGGPMAINIANNIFYGSEETFMGFMQIHDQYKMKNNIFYNYSGEEYYLGKKIVDQPGIMVADPDFVDPGHNDYRLADKSPALQAGFKPWDYQLAGLYGEDWWVKMPGKVKPDPYYPPAPPPKPTHLDDDFEDYLTGEYPEFPLNAILFVEGDATIHATDEKAATGRKSLKFTDAPGINSHNPHLEYHYNYSNDVITFSLDLLNGNDRPADIAIEFVDRHEFQNDATGPAIHISNQGDVSVSNKAIGNISAGKWHQIKIDFDLTDPTSQFILWIDKKNIGNFKYDSQFKAIDQLNISSVGEHTAEFYIDNIKVISE